MLVRPARRRWLPPLLLVVGMAAGLFALVGSREPAAADSPEIVYVRKDVFYTAESGMVDTDTSVSAQFVVNTHRWDSSSIPVSVKYNSTGAPAGQDVVAMIQANIGVWNSVTGAFSFAYGGSSSGNTGTCATTIGTDGLNTIEFKSLPGTTLGQTCTVWKSSQGDKLIEFDMELEDDASIWSQYDLQSTILHELGHAAGLGHSADHDSVMFPSLGAGAQKRTLKADDTAGLQAAYPGAPPATSTPSPSPTPTLPPPTPTPPPLPTIELPNHLRTMQLARD